MLPKRDLPPQKHPYRVQPKAKIDLSQIKTNDDSLYPVGKKHGKELFKEMANEIGELQELLYAEGKHKLLVVMQAMDTGGKDGTIKDVFREVTPQGLRVASFKRPSENELAHDYLWRVHSQVPANGEIVVFNRSHYEDVLIVRVHDLVPQKRWKRRYRHIVEFENMLVDEGTTIVKCFLHISKAEQKRRLQERLDNPEKRWKFAPGDLEERSFWDDYQQAYADMLSKTATDRAPWHIVPADNKWYRDLVVATILRDTLASLDLTLPDDPPNLDSIVIGD